MNTMSCRHARRHIPESLGGKLAAGVQAALDAHLAECAACREEADALRAAWDRLGRGRVPDAPADAWAKFAARVEGEPAGPGMGWRRPALAAAAVLVVFAGGVVTGRLTASIPRAADHDGTTAEYLLLLRNGEPNAPANDAGDESVEEYVRWARALESEDRLLGADRLAPDLLWLTDAVSPPRPAPSGDERVSGFFLITARDDAHAVATARESPHLRYGGVIEVRRIVH